MMSKSAEQLPLSVHCPIGWVVTSFGEVCAMRTEKFDPVEGRDTPYVALEHLEQDTGRLLGIGNSSETTSIKAVFKESDILFGKLRPYLRKYWYATFDGVCSTEIMPLMPKDTLDNRFSFYVVQQDRFIEHSIRHSFGTKMPRTSWKEASDIQCLLPPLTEQRKIAAILTSVDDAITATQHIIGQTEVVKRGLMQQLLTKGIGHKTFKQTEIGEIPQEWVVRTIGECCDIQDNKRIPLSQKERETMKGDIPYYGATKVVDYINKWLFDEDIVLIGEDGDHFKKFRSWSMTSLVRGKSWVNNHAHVLRAKSMVTNDWIYRFLEHRDITPFLAIQGATRLKLTQDSLRRIPIAIPPIEEQELITKIVSSIAARIESEKNYLVQLRQVKQGLLQVLLTGKLGVNVDEPSEASI